MSITNIHDAKTHLSQLIKRVTEGEEIIIAKAGIPMVKMVRYEGSKKPRQPGALRGKVKIADDFDALPEDIAAAFRGEKS